MLWLQGLFLFSLVWTVGGTITGESRKKFDVFFRDLISGANANYPKPKSSKITKVCSVNRKRFFLLFFSYF